MASRYIDVFLAGIVLSFLPLGLSAESHGVVKLDSLTFDKVMEIPGLTLLVKFDTSYPSGEKERAFKSIAASAYTVPDFIVASVPISDYGEKENDDLRHRFNLVKKDYPVHMLFNTANKEGLRYTGDVETPKLTAWLIKQGVPIPAVGTIQELNDIAEQFIKSGFKGEFITTAKQLVEDKYSADNKATWYAKIMERIVAKGIGYIQPEMDRVQQLIDGKLSEGKKAEMRNKHLILDVFHFAATAEAGRPKKDEL
eukprot:TRINITY_DN5200_c0_g1_i1.p2 TRINITY_DN5200_c0_g1~~TRINITY_DN5200_c0_g1_i1.p2  ORF type:complete len:254 (+),score=61.73 TRINITY_DN5200_c0_g1_i1:69-830(+)